MYKYRYNYHLQIVCLPCYIDKACSTYDGDNIFNSSLTTLLSMLSVFPNQQQWPGSALCMRVSACMYPVSAIVVFESVKCSQGL